MRQRSGFQAFSESRRRFKSGSQSLPDEPLLREHASAAPVAGLKPLDRASNRKPFSASGAQVTGPPAVNAETKGQALSQTEPNPNPAMRRAAPTTPPRRPISARPGGWRGERVGG